MSRNDRICRFCLINLNIQKRNFDIDDNISQLFHNLTGIELNKRSNLPTVTCEVCVRSLQHFSALKGRLIENQYHLLRSNNPSQSRETLNHNQEQVVDSDEVEPVSEHSIRKRKSLFRNPGRESTPSDQSDSDDAVEPFAAPPAKKRKQNTVTIENEQLYDPLTSSPIKIKTEPETQENAVYAIDDHSNDEHDPLNDSDPEIVNVEPEIKENCLNWTSDPNDLLNELSSVAYHECMYCHEQLPNIKSLKLHIKNIHSNEDNSEQLMLCPYQGCKSSFKKISSLNEHIKLHQSESPLKCEICGKNFISKDQLKGHMKYHQEPKYKCSVCDATFFDLKQLKYHQSIKHDNVRKFKCQICDKTYFKSSHLSRHNRVTHQKQTIYCIVPDCGRSYTRRERVFSHLLKQHTELPKEVIDGYVEIIKTTPYSFE